MSKRTNLKRCLPILGQRRVPRGSGRSDNRETVIILSHRPCLLRFIARCPEPFSCPLFHRIWHKLTPVSLIASLVLLTLALLPFPSSAWNIPGHAVGRHRLPGASAREPIGH